MPYTYPNWLKKTGEPVFWAYKNINGPRVVSQGVVKYHQRGRVYMVGKNYGFWITPEDVIQMQGDSLK